MSTQTGVCSQLVDLLGPDCDSPIAVIRQGQSDCVSIYTGTLNSAQTLADIPLNGDDVIAAVPFQQISERGFSTVEDNTELVYLTANKTWKLSTQKLVDHLPSELPDTKDLGFDISDEQYANLVDRVIKDEIGTGEGANFVIRRDYRAKIGGSTRSAALAWLKNLLQGEHGAYWTFAFIAPNFALIGASPERHVSASKGTVLMNPISGTFRSGAKQTSTAELLTFLADRKESEELVMVVDEELKMMSSVCPNGGVMRGPYLKPMSRVIHTEYLLEGKSDLDVRDILRLTMFAPTVTGSPMGNACSVIAKYEPSGRGYYSGVLAHFLPTKDGYELDAPILIRTAQVSKEGEVVVSAGATLVRHSCAESEAQETKVKVSGILTALGLVDATQTGTQTDSTDDPQVKMALENRNCNLAPFWRDHQPTTPFGIEGSVSVVNCGDDFANMLAHQLKHLGMRVTVEKWDQTVEEPQVDLMVIGHGPGDPLGDEPRIKWIRNTLQNRVNEGKATIAVGLGHQVLAALAGLPISALKSPFQGQPLEIDLFGVPSRIGFYNTYSAFGDDKTKTPSMELTVHAEPGTGIVHSLTAPGVASVQGHLESVLSLDGFDALGRMVTHVLKTVSPSTL